MAEIEQKTMAIYLFGDRNSEISALIGDPGFQELVRELFANGRAQVPPIPSRAADAAVTCGLLEKEGDVLSEGPRLVVIPASAEVDSPSLMRPSLASYVGIAAEVASELRRVYERTAASRRFGWPQVSHAIVAGMFLDLAMGNEVYGSGQILRRPVGDTVVWAFEGISARNAYGVQWTAGPQRTFFAQLWHRKVRRGHVRMTSALVSLLAEVALGSSGSLSAEELLYLRHLGLLRKSGSSFRVEVPVFGPDDSENLLPILVEGGQRLVADAIVPALDSLAYHPWWRERYRQDRYRHAAVRLVLEYGIDRVILSKTLEPFPEQKDLPVEWGRWLWIEPEGNLTLMPNILSREGETAST